MRAWLFIAGFVSLIGIGIYAEVQVWDECLKDHSWFYCNRVLNK